MPNYKESEIVGSQYQRARLIQINNELDQIPFITFCEERVTLLPDKVFHEDISQIVEPFSIGATFPIIDPVTEEVTEVTMTHAEFSNIVKSLYKHLAERRDGLQDI